MSDEDNKIKEEEKTKMTFKLESDTKVLVFQNGQEVGHIWSQDKSGGTPYPHTNHICCLNSIQICGFDKMSEVWACGVYKGKKDCVISFMPMNDGWYKEQLVKYGEYVKSFFDINVKKVKTPVRQCHTGEMNSREKIKELKSFRDWLQTGGCLE